MISSILKSEDVFSIFLFVDTSNLENILNKIVEKKDLILIMI